MRTDTLHEPLSGHRVLDDESGKQRKRKWNRKKRERES